MRIRLGVLGRLWQGISVERALKADCLLLIHGILGYPTFDSLLESGVLFVIGLHENHLSDRLVGPAVATGRLSLVVTNERSRYRQGSGARCDVDDDAVRRDPHAEALLEQEYRLQYLVSATPPCLNLFPSGMRLWTKLVENMSGMARSINSFSTRVDRL